MAFGHMVLLPIATNKYFLFSGANSNGPAKSSASSSKKVFRRGFFFQILIAEEVF